MTAPRWAAIALSAAALGLGACGGDDGGGDSGGSAQTTEQAPATGGGGASASNAQQTFANTCGGCHTLQAANTSGEVGPNLDELAPDEAAVKGAIENGPGVMPENLLQGADADAVAQYVAENAGN